MVYSKRSREKAKVPVGGGIMISEELITKMMGDKDFLQTCAVAIVREMYQNYEYTPEQIADKMGAFSLAGVRRWIAEDVKPNLIDSWGIVWLANREHVPVEAI